MSTLPVTVEDALEDLPDRIVVAVGYGVVSIPAPATFTCEGEVVRAGDLLARVESKDRTTDVRAPCDAWVLAYLVREGERVEPGAPVVHVRAL